MRAGMREIVNLYFDVRWDRWIALLSCGHASHEVKHDTPVGRYRFCSLCRLTTFLMD